MTSELLTLTPEQRASVAERIHEPGAVRLAAPVFVHVEESGALSIEWFPEPGRSVAFWWHPKEGPMVMDSTKERMLSTEDPDDVRDALATLVPLS